MRTGWLGCSPLRKVGVSEGQEGSETNRSARGAGRDLRGFRAASWACIEPARGRWSRSGGGKGRGSKKGREDDRNGRHESGNAGRQQGSPEQPLTRCSTFRSARIGRFGFQVHRVRKGPLAWHKKRFEHCTNGDDRRTAKPASVCLGVCLVKHFGATSADSKAGKTVW